ncbi:hypothetical protein A3O11_07185 [Ligilactobacillus aviarius]|uniref:hypothetical protein n=1 Tax=Ligilactobacillus aviarius TaxID=1606 RepID=UPI0007D92122|nr:hypothetical protein [Ligilactobacillus aviarius]OAQ03042.1 hypothetical protein A3O11_07185 [Ligilactobacillus aviarius]OAQ04611.1 hypothetical protein A3O10_03720 [Ligilactobacillus aviarius]OAS79006.1 hypothetical protein A3O18_06115 [Ligilactobacillus aviarius]PEG71287.1 hypothetical protein A3P04_02000 [Ligilactobacillus aviarius]PEG73275.1 hypothetical protein A3O82_07135 [Ligilactobacillus aviarius]
MQSKEVTTFHNIMRFKKENANSGLIDIDHLYIDLSNEDQNECFIQNTAKQILKDHLWYTGVQFKLKGNQQIRNFIIDHYPQIAHAIQQLDPLVVAKDEQANDQNTTQLSKWLKVNDFLAVQLARVKVEDVEEPFIK